MCDVPSVLAIRECWISSPQSALLMFARPKLSKYPDGYPGDAPAEDGDEPSEKKKANRPGAEPGPSRGGHGKALGGLEEKLESVKLKEGVN